MDSVCRGDDAALLAEAELELPLRRVRRTYAHLEIAALVQLDGLPEHLEGALLAHAAEERDAPAVVGRADAAPEVDSRAARACHEDRQLVLLVDARLRLAVGEAQTGLEAARRSVVDQRVLGVRVDAAVAHRDPLGHAEVGR